MILTNEEARQLNDACNEGAANCCETERHGYVKGFDDGIEWALQNLLPSRMEKFAEWMHNNFTFDDGENKWFSKHDTGPFTLEQIIDFYIQHQESKQKEDVLSGK